MIKNDTIIPIKYSSPILPSYKRSQPRTYNQEITKKRIVTTIKKKSAI